MKSGKKWIKPQLIVLGRGDPQENVLVACKNTTTNGYDTVPTARCKNQPDCVNRAGS